MSQFENIVAFEAALKESKELQEKFEAAKKRIVENNGATNKAELLAKAATEVGFALNVADLERAIAEAQELSEEELEQVSGGIAKARASVLPNWKAPLMDLMFRECTYALVGNDPYSKENNTTTFETMTL